MFTKVLHLPESELRDFPISEDQRVAKAKELYKERKYVHVAEILLGGSLSHLLDKAYEMTNSVFHAWYKESADLISVEAKALNGCRSTSVGDIIIVPGGEPYMVAGCGFIYVGDE